MELKRKNRSIFIDKEAVSALSMVKHGILKPVTGLMGKKEADEVNRTKEYKGKSFPFSFILAPNGRRNKEVLSSANVGEKFDLVCEGLKVGEIVNEEVFKIDPLKRVQNIYDTTDRGHIGVQGTLKRLGEYAISGKYEIEFDDIIKTKERIKEAKANIGASTVSALMLAAKPLHRAHERMIRLALDSSDLVVIFILKPYKKDLLSYDIRKKSVDYFIDNFLPKERVIALPFENTYLFGGSKEMILNAIAAQNFGCNKLITSQNHAGLGMFYEENVQHSIFDTIKGVDIEIDIMNEFVYCNLCKTLVSTKTCPHGQHHHISYHANSILELLKLGILPPAMLVRKEISAIILSELFPNRFKNLEKLYYDILPITGLLENHNEKEFYIELMNLYQTTSLT